MASYNPAVVSYADVVGTVGLVLAAVSSVWQARTARLQRPQLNVSITETKVYQHDDDAEPTEADQLDAYFTIRVVNYGGLPVDLLDVGLVQRVSRGMGDRIARESCGIAENGLVAKGPKLPRRIEAGGHLEWLVPGSSVADWWRGGETFAAFARTVGRPTVRASDGVVDVRSHWRPYVPFTRPSAG